MRLYHGQLFTLIILAFYMIIIINRYFIKKQLFIRIGNHRWQRFHLKSWLTWNSHINLIFPVALIDQFIQADIILTLLMIQNRLTMILLLHAIIIDTVIFLFLSFKLCCLRIFNLCFWMNLFLLIMLLRLNINFTINLNIGFSELTQIWTWFHFGTV